MDLFCSCAQRESPLPRGQLSSGFRLGVQTVTVWGIRWRGSALCRSIQRTRASYAVILTAQKPEEIRKRHLPPVHGDFRGLQARRRTGNIPLHEERARRLQGHSAPPRLGLQPQLPSAARNLLDTPGNADKSKRQFVCRILKIDPPIVELDPLQTVDGRNRRRWSVNS